MTRLVHRPSTVILGYVLVAAVTVFAGMLIFIFFQDFAENSEVESPVIEQIAVWGYNATDSADKLGSHTGDEVTVSNLQNNSLTDGEDFFVFIRNSGETDVFISQVKIIGILLASDTTFSSSENLDAKAGTWIMSTNGKDPCRCQIIKSGKEATIAIGYDEEIDGKLVPGKPIHVNIITGEGTSFSKHVIFGHDEGIIKPKLRITLS